MYTYLMAASFVAIFYIVANHEYLGARKWAGISLGLSVFFLFLVPILFVVAQGVLFGFLYRAHLQRQADRPKEIQALKEEMELERANRRRRATQEWYEDQKKSSN